MAYIFARWLGRVRWVDGGGKLRGYVAERSRRVPPYRGSPVVAAILNSMTPHHYPESAPTSRARKIGWRFLLISMGLVGSRFVPFAPLDARAGEYHIGPGQAFNSIGAVPWSALVAGDTVFVHWRAEPYREKILISNSGTLNRPIRIRGVPSEEGQLPTLDGDNATTSSQFKFPYSGTAARGLVVISRSQAEQDGYKPKYIEIDGLELRNADPLHTFRDDQGQVTPYRANASSVFVERGEYITIRNCRLTGCGNGLFVASGDGEAYQSREILVQGNEIFGNGNVNSDREHSIYTEAIGMTFEFNRMGPLRPGALGNNLKDRSAGTVVRYNWIEGGTQQLDLVDPEGSANQALADPRFRSTLVYGNIIINEAVNANVVHYGGDSSVTEIYRKGTLYFYHNAVIFRSDQRLRYRVGLLRLDTNDETADVRNNILYHVAAGPDAPLSELSLMLVNGKAQVGVNWVSEGWLPSRTGVPFEGTLTGTENLLTGTDPGFASSETGDFSLKAGSPCVDKATPRAVAISEEFEVTQQYAPHAKAAGRVRSGAALDLGALESDTSRPLVSIQALASDQLQINLLGRVGKYRLDLSNDLKSWREWVTRTNTGGNVEFLITNVENPGFYRAVLLAPQ